MKFIITALPRSGTSWASLWLMTDTCLCLHDPIGPHYTPSQLLMKTGNFGISCTSAWAFNHFLKKATCPKILLDRNIDEINESLNSIGLPAMPRESVKAYQRLPYFRLPYTALFNKSSAQTIWEMCHPETPFNVERWELMKQLQVQPDFANMKFDATIILKTVIEAQAELGRHYVLKNTQ